MTRNSRPQWANKKKPVERIGTRDVMPMVLDVCPFYTVTWKKHLDAYDGDELLYVALPDLLHTCIDRLAIGSEKQVVSIFQAIEKLCDLGNEEVRQLIRVSIFEEFEHIFGEESARFEKYLGPISRILRVECEQRLVDLPYHRDSLHS